MNGPRVVNFDVRIRDGEWFRAVVRELEIVVPFVDRMQLPPDKRQALDRLIALLPPEEPTR